MRGSKGCGQRKGCGRPKGRLCGGLAGTEGREPEYLKSHKKKYEHIIVSKDYMTVKFSKG